MATSIVVFDLDGTLVDTAPDLVDTLNAVITPEGLSPVSYESARHLVGGGAKLMIERALRSQNVAYTPERLDQLFANYIAHYSEHIAEGSRPFPGVEPMLDELEQLGYRFAICTNKLEQLARLLLDKLSLTQRFAFICGQDTFGVPKPDPTPLRRTIEAVDGELASAVMVGDSETDIHTARAAGIPIIAVDFGYSVRPIAELGADRLIGHFRDLPKAIREVTANI